MTHDYQVVTYYDERPYSTVDTNDGREADRLFVEGVAAMQAWPVRGLIYTIDGRDRKDVRTMANRPVVTDKYTHIPSSVTEETY